MTQNQINYWKFKEDQRHNLAQESHNERSLNEQVRSNVAKESETRRSNLAHESETNRSNVAREMEANRSNLASEEQARINALNTMVYNQGKLSQDYREYELDKRKQDETERHNAVVEALNEYQTKMITLPEAAARIRQIYTNMDATEIQTLLKQYESEWYNTDKIIEYLERGQKFANNMLTPITDFIGAITPNFTK
jgi:hypothetical protein